MIDAESRDDQGTGARAASAWGPAIKPNFDVARNSPGNPHIKPSLLRILNTLQDAGFVRDGGRPLPDQRLRGVGRKRDRHDRVAEAAALCSTGSAKTCGGLPT
jgi:hypothetical protein